MEKRKQRTVDSRRRPEAERRFLRPEQTAAEGEFLDHAGTEGKRHEHGVEDRVGIDQPPRQPHRIQKRGGKAQKDDTGEPREGRSEQVGAGRL